MITTSETLDKFAAAMALVQAEIGGAIKGNVNPAFKSKYADLSAVWEAFQAVGPRHGISIMQMPGLYDPVAKTMTMHQIVMHSSGQSVRSELSVPLSKPDAQGYGSAVTYARRYSLAAAVGICPEDDDGNAASRPADRQVERVATINDAQRVELIGLADAAGADMKAFCTYFRIDALPELPANQIDRARAMLQKKLADRAKAEKVDA